MAELKSSPLVDIAWLAERLGAPDLVVLDATWHMPAEGRDARAEYAAGHIPGAALFDIDAIADHHTVLPHMLPSPAEFATAVRRLGVSAGSTVVAYDTAGLFSAPRAWWSFRAMGHERVFVLDGGLPAWTAAGHPVETGWRESAHGDFRATLRPALIRDLAGVREIVASGSTQLVDARAAPRFRGEAPEPRAGLKSGHMPGAKNVPWSQVISPDGRLADAPALEAAFRSGGVDLEASVVATCGSGISASLLALALARLGRWDAAVYDGSWTEWGGRSDTPVETGA